MAKLNFDLVAKIETSKTFGATHRGYLGMSQLGHSCDRYLYYILHDMYRGRFTPRTMRIFERGDWEEERVIRDLKYIGYKVIDTQLEVCALGEHIRGHIDGVVYDKDNQYLLEIKTASNSSWNNFKKKGVLLANKQYYTQVQLYMYYLKLNKCWFIVTNKDNEHRYFEEIPAVTKYAEEAEFRALMILGADKIPDKIGGPDWYECKFCSMREICHENEKVHINCRSCKHCTFKMAGGFSCKLGKEQTELTMKIGCAGPYWESVDA